jgi:cytochrome c nitrite reductase small subunit
MAGSAVEPPESRPAAAARSRSRSSAALILGLAAAVGSAVGLGGYTFVYAHGSSYLQNDPAACANCHVMNEQYDAYLKSSHRAAATCNDCHAPHDVVGKYWTKASNGFWHSFAFTSGRHPDPIHIKPHNLEITEQACRHCHGPVVHALSATAAGPGDLSCVRCHRSVGHLH